MLFLSSGAKSFSDSVDAALHERLNLGAQLVKRLSKGGLMLARLAILVCTSLVEILLVLLLRHGCLNSHRCHHVAALLSGLPSSGSTPVGEVAELLRWDGIDSARLSRESPLINLTDGLVHELQAAHLQLLDRGHVNLWHVVLLVARIDILRDGLGLGHKEVLTVFICLKRLNGERWLFKAVIEHNLLVFNLLLLAKLCSLLLGALTARMATHHLQEGCLWHLTDVVVCNVEVEVLLRSDIAIEEGRPCCSSCRARSD